MEDLIFRYLDGECTVEEIQQVEHLIASNPDFAQLFTELNEANQLLMTTPLDEAPKGFTNSVMQQIAPQFLPKLQDMLLPKILLGALIVLLSAMAISYLPQTKDFGNTIGQYMNQNIAIYGSLLILFFLVLEWFLSKKDSETLNKRI